MWPWPWANDGQICTGIYRRAIYILTEFDLLTSIIWVTLTYLHKLHNISYCWVKLYHPVLKWFKSSENLEIRHFYHFSAAILNRWNHRKSPIIENNLDIGPKNLYTKFSPNLYILSTFRGLMDKSGVMFICDLDLEPRSRKGHPQNTPCLHYLWVYYDGQICNGIYRRAIYILTEFDHLTSIIWVTLT